MATLTHAGAVGHCISAGPPSKCRHLLGILWTFYGQVTELLENAAGAFVEEDASFEGRSGNPILEGANTHADKSRLTGEVAHGVLIPQPQQAMGLLEAGQESQSFSSESWNTEIPAASPKSEPAPARVLPTERPTSRSHSAPQVPPCHRKSFIFLQVKLLTVFLRQQSRLPLFCGGREPKPETGS